MPIYDYLCATCGPFEERRPMSESKAAVPCSICRDLAPRLPGAPRLNLMSSNNRIAETRNEKSAHEPDVVHTLAPHGGHAHGKPQRHPAQTHAHAHSHTHSKAPRVSDRPWMLGH